MKKIGLLLMIGLIFIGSFKAQAQADPVKARNLTEKGIRLYQQKRYQEAIYAFSESYQISKHPLRLQNIAKCYEKLKEYGKAIEYQMEFTLLVRKEVARENQLLFKLIQGYIPEKGRISKIKIDWWQKQIEADRLTELTALIPLTALTWVKDQLYEPAIPLIQQSIILMNTLGYKTEGAYFAALLNKALLEKTQAQMKKGRVITQVLPPKKEKPKVLARNKKIGWALVATGSAIFAAAVVLVGFAGKYIKEANDIYDKDYMNSQTPAELNSNYKRFEEKRDQSKPYLITGVVLGAVGLSAIITGVWFLVKHKKPPKTVGRLSLTPLFKQTDAADGLIMKYQLQF